ncbi:MAG: immunoglobulin domain-containing protein [Verrucomicrobiota bacterium]
MARFSTRGSSFDTLLAVYTNGVPSGPLDLANLGGVAGDDDRGGFHTSEVVFNAVGGTEYLIAIDGFGRASGNIVLSWNLDPNIAEVPRIFQQPVSQTVAPRADVTFSVFAASAQPLFYQWVFNCELIPDATNAVLTVTNVQAAKVGSYSVRVSNSPDWPGDGQPGQCPACLTSLQAFLEIGPDSKVLSQDKLGDVTAALTRPSRQSAPLHGQSVIGSVFPGILGTQILNNFGATTEQGEPNHAGVIGGASRWRRLTPDTDGLLQVDTLGSKVDTVLAVYTGTDLLDLQLVAEDNNSGPDGFTSVVRFPAKRGTNYLVAADAANEAQGEIHLNWGLGSPPASSQAPTNRVVRLGETIALLTEATGTPAPSLQWRWNGAPLAGRTNATLTLTNFQAAQAGTYSVVASNFLGTLTNEVATLTLAELLRLHSAAFLTNGTFRLLLSGDLGPKTVVQASSNLLNWLPIFTNLTPAAPIEVIDAGASNHPLRFYRAVQ